MVGREGEKVNEKRTDQCKRSVREGRKEGGKGGVLFGKERRF